LVSRAGDKIGDSGVVEIPYIWGLFKNVQMRGAQNTEARGVYRYTLSGAVCSATQQMSVFQQPHSALFHAKSIIKQAIFISRKGDMNPAH